MSLQLDQLRATADRVAASHQLEVVDVEFSGGAKFRTLRIFLEKNAEQRAKLAELAAKGELEDIPKTVPAEALSGVTHEDCAVFATDFGTLLDVEDLIPGAEYTLEVSSPGLERKLTRADDYKRFTGSLIKLQTVKPVIATGAAEGKGSRQWQGRLTAFTNNTLTLDLAAIKQKGKPKKNAAKAAANTIDIPLDNVEKANLIAEI